MLKVAITGSTGLVGSRIQELLYHKFEFIPLLHAQVDITDKKQVEDFMSSLDFDIFLHLTGYTNVDGAETNQNTARQINVVGTKNVFDETKKRNKKFIYISTDFVFDGTKPPYTEESTPHPIGVYGLTKYEGEQVVKNRGMIVRISYPYRSSFGKKTDFVRSLHRLLKEGKSLSMITDSSITLTYIDDIAASLSHLMTHFSPEIYHIVGGASMSPYEAALAIAKRFDLDKKLIGKTTFREFSKGRAPRPQHSIIKSIKNNFHLMLPFEEVLQKLVIEDSRL